MAETGSGNAGTQVGKDVPTPPNQETPPRLGIAVARAVGLMAWMPGRAVAGGVVGIAIVVAVATNVAEVEVGVGVRGLAPFTQRTYGLGLDPPVAASTITHHQPALPEGTV
jgi:hypothetical protein